MQPGRDSYNAGLDYRGVLLYGRTKNERKAPMLPRQHENEEQGYRFRVLVAVPPGGWGGQLALIAGWLDQHCGRAGWSAAPAGIAGVVNDAVAFYFPDPAAARAFVARFSCGYRAAPGDRL